MTSLPAIVLHHCVSARSFRVLWMLEELNLPYELKMMPFPPRVHAREFLSVNPLGTVPAFAVGDTVMTESAAICEYLAARFGEGRLAVRSDAAEFGAYLNWLHYGEATLTFPQTLLLRYGRFEPAERRAPQVVEDYTRWFLARLRAVETAVARSEFLCGERFTAADVSVGYALMLADYLGLADRFPTLVCAYWSRLSTRDGFTQAQAAQERAAVAQGVATTPAPLV